jgi:hypothetical protein
MMRPPPSRPGRKPRVANRGQRPSLGLKVTPEIKNKLDAAAKENGRTQSQEAESRIEQTFHDDDQLAASLVRVYGAQLTGLLLVIARAMKEAGTHAGFRTRGTYEGAVDWFSDAAAFRQAAEATRAVLDAFDSKDAPSDSNLGRELAAGAMEAIKYGGRTDEMRRWAEEPRSLLGEAALARMRFDDDVIAIDYQKPTPDEPAIVARLLKEPDDGEGQPQ